MPKKLALVIKSFSRRTNHAQRFNSTTDATATEENDATASEENDDNATEENVTRTFSLRKTDSAERL